MHTYWTCPTESSRLADKTAQLFVVSVKPRVSSVDPAKKQKITRYTEDDELPAFKPPGPRIFFLIFRSPFDNRDRHKPPGGSRLLRPEQDPYKTTVVIVANRP